MHRSRGFTLRSLASTVLATVAVAGAGLGVAVSSTNASPGVAQATPTTTCPTTYPFPGNSDATVPCTSTTVPSGHPRLIISYSSGGPTAGVVSWQACGYPAAAVGGTVSLELDGVRIGPTGRLRAGGCTSDPEFKACLSAGSYNGVDLVQGYPSASATLTVSAASGCKASGSGPTGGITTATVTPAANANGDVLAFTGANIRRDVIAGVALLLSGLVLLGVSRRRRATAR